MSKQPSKLPKNLKVSCANEAFETHANENAMPDTIAIPYGSYPYAQPMDGGAVITVTQVFDRAGAAAIANELAAKVAAKKSKGIPVYEGHPDVPGLAASYPSKAAIGWITAIAANEAAAELSVRWLRNPGEGFAWHSPYWGGALTATSANAATMRVSQLLSLALTNNPSIKDFRLPNEEPDEPTQTEKEEEAMNELMKKLAALLGLAETATEADILAAINTALAEKKTAQDAAAQVATANERAAKAHGALVDHLVTAAITDGRITGADKATWTARLANEATFDAEGKNLAALAPSLKTAPAATQKRDAASLSEGKQLMRLANEIQTANLGMSFDKAWAQLKDERPELFKK